MSIEIPLYSVTELSDLGERTYALSNSLGKIRRLRGEILTKYASKNITYEELSCDSFKIQKTSLGFLDEEVNIQDYYILEQWKLKPLTDESEYNTPEKGDFSVIEIRKWL